MGKQGGKGRVLELARRAILGIPITEMPPTRFYPGDKVRLRVGGSLNNAKFLTIQYFPKGARGKVVGQAGRRKVIVCLKREDWIVNEGDLTPLKKRA